MSTGKPHPNTIRRNWRAALEIAIETNPQALEEAAKKLLEQAAQGNLAALKELGDRIDGKPAQIIEGPDGGPAVIERIERVIIDPEHTDS